MHVYLEAAVVVGVVYMCFVVDVEETVVVAVVAVVLVVE